MNSNGKNTLFFSQGNVAECRSVSDPVGVTPLDVAMETGMGDGLHGFIVITNTPASQDALDGCLQFDLCTNSLFRNQVDWRRRFEQPVFAYPGRVLLKNLRQFVLELSTASVGHDDFARLIDQEHLGHTCESERFRVA